MSSFNEVIAYWFEELEEDDWWKKSDSLDKHIRERFGQLHQRAVACELCAWRAEPLGRLAEIIVLDQFSRNMFRNSAKSFAQDPQALSLAQEAITDKADAELDQLQRSFLYMPFMHSESGKIHEQAVELFRNNGIQSNYDFELKHKAIIDRFGRYPHRNKLLNRTSTSEEQQFLLQPGSSF
ncbi:MAG: DUF924 domain-containing protein [Pseudomonadales bacterium]|nr:DUF924 domain-containing protein [Pseudomonadales bacterium]RZV48964.1 MAG: DUF924 domain-containing protein [Pseudomonadales bacterium]